MIKGIQISFRVLSKSCLTFLVFSLFVVDLSAQKLTQIGSFLLTTSRDSVPAGEVWKITGSFGAAASPVFTSTQDSPLDTAALAKKYSALYNLDLANIKPQDLRGGMIMKDVLPVWLATGSRFSVDPGDLMELFVERYKIQATENSGK